MTVQQFAVEAKAQPSTVRDRLASAGIDPKGELTPLAIAVALWHLLTKKEETKEKRAAKERKEQAQAEKAEIEVAQLKGLLMFREDAGRLFADVFVRIRQTIDEESDISPEIKERLSRKFLDIKLGE